MEESLSLQKCFGLMEGINGLPERHLDVEFL